MKYLTAVTLFIGLLAFINEAMCELGRFNNFVVAYAARSQPNLLFGCHRHLRILTLQA